MARVPGFRCELCEVLIGLAKHARTWSLGLVSEFGGLERSREHVEYVIFSLMLVIFAVLAKREPVKKYI